MRTNRNRIEFDDRIIRRYPLQAHDQRDIDLIAARHEAARHAGLPVPAVLEVHRQGPHPYLVMERAGGSPLMETVLSQAAERTLGRDLARMVGRMRGVHEWFDHTGPQWSTLWQVLERVTGTDECRAAADVAGQVETSLVHGDLSAGNLLVSEDGDLVAVIDWDGAALADIAMDWAALCANCPPGVVATMRDTTSDAAELERRAGIYLATWPIQHDLWESGGHPWLSGSVPVAEPRL
jgi:aminoglycoside phosphotransferase (APT) family kinase protein